VTGLFTELTQGGTAGTIADDHNGEKRPTGSLHDVARLLIKTSKASNAI
jgi:hypothetical protein